MVFFKVSCYCCFFLHLLQKDIVNSYKCGADFLPSPLASKPEFALKAEAVYTRKGQMTAVAIAVEHDHTIAFLGNSVGEIFKVNVQCQSHCMVLSKAQFDIAG